MSRLGPIRSRRLAGAAFASAVTAVAAPMANLARERPRDSFPLSHYPMFSHERGSLVEVVHLRGRTSGGEIRPLDSRLAASGGMNQERKQIARAARQGRAARLAARAARRVGRREALSDVVEVELVSAVYPLAGYFAARPLGAVETTVLARAPVPDDRRGRPPPGSTRGER